MITTVTTELEIGRVNLTLEVEVNYDIYDNSDCGGGSDDVDYYMTSYTLYYKGKPLKNVSRHEDKIDNVLRSEWLDGKIRKEIRG